MGRHHTNPPNPGTHPPKRRAPPQKGEGQGPPAPHTEQGPARGDGQPDTPHPRRAHKHGPTHGNKGGARRSRNHYTNHDQPTPHPTHHTTGQDTPPHDGPTKGGGGRHDLVVVTAPGKRPATFRTWKLSPAAPMVLHPRGCGRVGNRHNTPPRGAAHTSAAPPHTHTPNQPTHARARDHARNNAHAPPRATTRTHASAHKRHPAGDNTRTPQTSTHTPTPATTRTRSRTRASYCARLPSNLRSFMFQQSSGR